jgi:hypothetical protein
MAYYCNFNITVSLFFAYAARNVRLNTFTGMIVTRALIKREQGAMLFQTWTWTPHRRMLPINISLLRATKPHPFTTWRFFSTVNTHEAFLQSVRSHPGVTTLSLNRPHAKNAISLQLLKVRVHHFYFISQSPRERERISCSQCRAIEPSNSPTAWTPSASTTPSACSS